MKQDVFDTRKDLIDYIFRQVLPNHGFKVREPQIELCHQMNMALDNHQISLSEAEVGTGKTFSYIIACVVNNYFKEDDLWSRMNYPHAYDFTLTTKMPYIIATSSIELQNAIVNDYIPKLSKILLKEKIIDTPLTAVIRKGKRNYICDRKLNRYIKDIQDSDNPSKELKTLLNIVADDEIDLDNVTGLSSYDKRRIAVTRCPKNCSERNRCTYIELREEHLNPDIMFQVCNHNYYIADINHKRNGMKNLLPCYRGVIIDEAHKFTDALADMYKKKLGKSDLLITFNRISKKLELSKSYARVNEIMEHATNHINELYDSFSEQVDVEEVNAYINFPVKVHRHHIFKIKLIASYLKELQLILIETFGRLYPYKTLINDIRSKMVSFVCNKTHIYWLLSSTRGFDSLCSLPISIQKTYRKDIWNRSLPVILTSGTLSINDNFDYIRSKLGLEVIADNKYDEISEKSPFDYKNNCMIYFSQNTINPKYKDELYINSISKEIIKLTTATEGRSLVLFTSYRVLNSVYQNIIDKIEYPIIVSERGNRKAVEEFKKTTNGILLSTDAWEGVDVEGELLSSLIIVKLPFPIPNITKQIRKRNYSDFRDYMNNEVIPSMQIKLKQGAGRLIRSETDRGVICILDTRYKDKALEALPKCKVTNEINDIENFLSTQTFCTMGSVKL